MGPQERPEPTDIAIYAHGGLTGEETAAETAARWIPALYEARIFPIFLMWETDLWSTLKNRLADLVTGQPRPTGGFVDQLKRFWNRRLERLAGAGGSRIWGEMKQNADGITGYAESGGRILYESGMKSPWFTKTPRAAAPDRPLGGLDRPLPRGRPSRPISDGSSTASASWPRRRPVDLFEADAAAAGSRTRRCGVPLVSPHRRRRGAGRRPAGRSSATAARCSYLVVESFEGGDAHADPRHAEVLYRPGRIARARAASGMRDCRRRRHGEHDPRRLRRRPARRWSRSSS